MDAPWHYFPTCNGEPSKRIDEVPLEDCFGEGVVLDLLGHGPGERVDRAAPAARATSAVSGWAMVTRAPECSMPLTRGIDALSP